MIRKDYLDVLACFEIITTEAAQILSDNSSNLSGFYICHHRLEAVTLKRSSRNSVINIKHGIAEIIILCVLLEDSLLVGDAVALTL